MVSTLVLFVFNVVFVVDCTPSYFVATPNDDGTVSYSNWYDNAADAWAFADCFNDGSFVVLRDPLDFSNDGVRVTR